MFEKEAEEYTNKYWDSLVDSEDRELLGEAFKDGAEFGYNKANEWHYVKDGKNPTHENDVTVLYQDCDKLKTYTCLYDTHSESWMYYNLDNMWLERFDYKVIAWKEIVLPELKEAANAE